MHQTDLSVSFELDPKIFTDPNLKEHKDCALTELELQFKRKGGYLHVVKDFSGSPENCFTLQSEDALYPICSGGTCRSQALYEFLRQKLDPCDVVLFPPHAARCGYDPYNGEVRYYTAARIVDEFEIVFEKKRTVRFGYDCAYDWHDAQGLVTTDKIPLIKTFYDTHYYGPQSHFQGKRGKRRIYMAFAHPTHAVLKRLVETNETLENVALIAIPLQDEITTPPPEMRIQGGSPEAYRAFLKKMEMIFRINV
ncbi:MULTISPECIES: hypothetical protein [Parachlamydia]|jgi:hypothetical protein|uniref:Uncharacterized protein n=2 Tax=Parachlamydia acanthamoebae TaxID=83552 RepID=F8KY32_PARAV|nr:hypothetical protein [Parachlamydia acanthamoebae]EFB40896.1 hypothetical protein pah_c180o093 [Parachlamydia acanthamoebae str. Hall's coccus]KIA78463.1 hypothetical protein DB43_DY00140 [Parachlamydia acanthamoebae]CCB85777.1 putative uncharacterized protein [Parachlamydia acanthamoebae UV-7]